MKQVHDFVTNMFVLPRFPATRAEQYALAVTCLPRLVDRWTAMKLSIRPSMHVLVFRPGELGPSVEAATHRSDQLDALVAEQGGAGVAVSLTDNAEGLETFVALTLIDPHRVQAPATKSGQPRLDDSWSHQRSSRGPAPPTETQPGVRAVRSNGEQEGSR